MFVAIDQGNTALKATFLDDTQTPARLVETMRLDPSALYELPALMAAKGATGAMLCSVCGIDPDLVAVLSRTPGCKVLVFSHQTPLPISVDYATPHTLGLDRLAAAAGAAALFPGRGVVVADAGTALTVDAVDPSGCFRGGQISPGVALRLASLHRAAPKLPLVQPAGPVPEFGYDTETALRSGALRGVCAEIESAFARAKRRFSTELVAVTGGDRDLIAKLLRDDYLLAGIVADIPHLVAAGLLSIFKHNEA